MDLIIATHNTSKYNSVKNLITNLECGVKVNLSQIDHNIPKAKEDGASAKENCLSKIKHYKKYVTLPFIVIDDEISFDTSKDNLNFGHNFHTLGGKKDLDPKEIFVFLQNYLLKAKTIKMTRIRYFGLVNKIDIKITTSSFDSYLEPLRAKIFNKMLSGEIQANPINYFSKPIGYNKTIMSYNSQIRNRIVYGDKIRNEICDFINNQNKEII